MVSKRAVLLTVVVAAGPIAAASANDQPPPVVPLPAPLTIASPVPQPPVDWGQRFEFQSWRSDRSAGVVRERVRFIFCSSLTPGPFNVTVSESKGWELHSRPYGVPRFVETGRFTLRLTKRYPAGVPQCRQISYSWRAKRVMLTSGARAMDLTITYPVAAWDSIPNWPQRLEEHEVTMR